jgi:hypothetical protein
VGETASDDGHDSGPADDLRREEGEVDSAEDPDGFEVEEIAARVLAEQGRQDAVSDADLDKKDFIRKI